MRKPKTADRPRIGDGGLLMIFGGLIGALGVASAALQGLLGEPLGPWTVLLLSLGGLMLGAGYWTRIFHKLELRLIESRGAPAFSPTEP